MSDDTKKPESIREKATAKRRNQILEAAVMCFLERGYHQTGVRDIAAEALRVGHPRLQLGGKEP